MTVIGLTTYAEHARMLVWERDFALLHASYTVTGRADDGTVEAVEVAGQEFAVGVQWHPEEDARDVRLFAALVEAGRRYRERLHLNGGVN